VEQREGDPGDLAGLLGRGCCTEGERKEGDGAAGWASLSVPVQGMGSAGEWRRLVGMGTSEGLWRVGPRSCLCMTALWAWRGGGAGNMRVGELTLGRALTCGPGSGERRGR